MARGVQMSRSLGQQGPVVDLVKDLQTRSQAIAFSAFVTSATLAGVKMVEHQSQLAFQLPLW